MSFDSAPKPVDSREFNKNNIPPNMKGGRDLFFAKYGNEHATIPVNHGTISVAFGEDAQWGQSKFKDLGKTAGITAESTPQEVFSVLEKEWLSFAKEKGLPTER